MSVLNSVFKILEQIPNGDETNKIEDGTYKGYIVSAERRKSKHGRDMVVFKYLLEVEDKSMAFNQYMMISSDEDGGMTDNIQAIKGQVSSFGIDEVGDLDDCIKVTNQLVNLPVEVKVSSNFNGTKASVLNTIDTDIRLQDQFLQENGEQTTHEKSTINIQRDEETFSKVYVSETYNPFGI